MGNVINLLVTTAGGSGVYSVIESVKTSKHNINLVLIDGSELAGGLYEGYKSYKVPFVNSDEYLCVIKEIIKKENIEYMISLLDEELIYLSDKQLPIKTLIPSKDALYKAWDKIETYHALKNYMSETCVLSGECDLRSVWKKRPILLKPALSRGGRGIVVPEDFEEFEFFAKRFIKKKIPYLVQKFVEGKEYNITTLHDKKGRVVYAIPRWKFETRLIKSGSKASVVVENNEVVEFALKVLEELGLNYGFNNVEVIQNEDGIYLLEINAGRIAAQDMNIVKSGVNIVDLFIDIVNGKKVDPVKVKPGMCNIKISKDIGVEFEEIQNVLKEYNENINNCRTS
ncbi:MAG: ATP-grasp domain-containing protein [Epsilonproteobacteria bacterium]|nr:ATP-grasp domain-containing protein [Campylobacterota bacterium]